VAPIQPRDEEMILPANVEITFVAAKLQMGHSNFPCGSAGSCILTGDEAMISHKSMIYSGS
jgi:hypothetical protein